MQHYMNRFLLPILSSKILCWPQQGSLWGKSMKTGFASNFLRSLSVCVLFIRVGLWFTWVYFPSHLPQGSNNINKASWCTVICWYRASLCVRCIFEAVLWLQFNNPSLPLCIWMCVDACARFLFGSFLSTSLTERLELIVICPSTPHPLWSVQGGKEPASLPTKQATAGRVPVCGAGAHSRAHPGLRKEGRAAWQVPSWRFCQSMLR